MILIAAAVARIAFTPHPTGYAIYSIAGLGHYEDEQSTPNGKQVEEDPGNIK